MVSLPYSRKKRYLTGIDWMIGALDHLARKSTGAGISSQVVLELDRPLPEEELREWLEDRARALPALAGAPARDINLAPYWKVPERVDEAPIDFVVHRPPSESPGDVLACLTAAVNKPFESDSRHLAFHVIYLEPSDRCLVTMVFDHRLLDARGAEMLLDAIQRNDMPPLDPEPAHLDRWLHRFRVGRNINRTLAPMGRSPIDTIPLPADLAGRPSRFVLSSLDEDETRAIKEAAEREAGYLIVMPYVLAVTLQQLDVFLAGKGYPHGSYVVPVSMDMRSERKRQVLFNRLSFILLHVKSSIVGNRPASIQIIRQQMYDQAKVHLQRDLCDVTMLMRIAPVSMLARLMLKIRLMLGSLSFSCVGDSAYASDTFLGARILNLFHLPRVPTPPGYGFFFNEFNSGMNVVFSYIDGMLTEDEANELVGHVVTALLQGDG